MTREQREQELNCLRQCDPAGLVAAYRAATLTPVTENLPRGMGFPGMIAAILDREFGAEQPPACGIVSSASQFHVVAHRATTLPVAAPRRRCLRKECAAFCSGAALVGLGLCLALCYLAARI